MLVAGQIFRVGFYNGQLPWNSTRIEGKIGKVK
jgi:hypothetical protein